MTGTHTGGPPARGPRTGAQRRRDAWRIGTPVVVLLSGGLFFVSADNSEGTDLRPGRYTDLASLVEAEADAYDGLQARVADLTDDVERLTDAVDDRKVERLQRRTDTFRDPAGLIPRTGPGVTVTLSDAPEDVVDSTTQDLNLLVVHQQDIQSVVNAMWAGGATAITIQGQRIITTTGIKCEGNAVQLQGRPYPQPYVISAVGDPAALGSSLEADPDVSGYREDSEQPDIQIGWSFDAEEQVEAAAYDGLLDLSYAEPLG